MQVFASSRKVEEQNILFFMVILSFFPLKNIIKIKKPDFLIIHLLTSLPLILLIIFNFTKNLF